MCDEVRKMEGGVDPPRAGVNENGARQETGYLMTWVHATVGEERSIPNGWGGQAEEDK